MGNATRGCRVCRWISGEGLGTRLTIRMQACFPSMKPLGMAFAARISYLETQCRSHDRAPLRCHQSVPPPSLLPAPTPNTHPTHTAWQAHRWRNSWKTILLGKPWRQIRMPSKTPLHRSCSSTRKASSLPDCKDAKGSGLLGPQGAASPESQAQ